MKIIIQTTLVFSMLCNLIVVPGYAQTVNPEKIEYRTQLIKIINSEEQSLEREQKKLDDITALLDKAHKSGDQGNLVIILGSTSIGAGVLAGANSIASISVRGRSGSVISFKVAGILLLVGTLAIIAGNYTLIVSQSDIDSLQLKKAMVQTALNDRAAALNNMKSKL